MLILWITGGDTMR